MPSTSKRIKKYRYSEESEEILSRIPAWLSQSLPSVCVLVYLFGFFLWLAFGFFRNDTEQMTVRLYPQMEKLKLNSFSRVDKIKTPNNSVIQQGDTLLYLTDINTRKKEVLLAWTSGKFKLATEVNDGDVFEANQILGAIVPKDVVYMAYGKLNLKGKNSNKENPPSRIVHLRYDSLLVEAKIVGSYDNEVIYALKGNKSLTEAFMVKDSIEMDIVVQKNFSLSGFFGL